MPPSSAKPSSPPPAYTELADPSSHHHINQPGLPYSCSDTITHTCRLRSDPIAQQTQLLPYYDPRSPYAIAEAAAQRDGAL
ncbi:hypothetical protein A0H81_09775 [Grifola frondosa]|uniref:Uncharacterized protein n=1 Tax=Grifola frondosa TaxID=5627 RepID=A0A1C7M1C1_GRIFR|nr:hypothetical protein A0H81_09775 [Grifola frondosa]